MLLETDLPGQFPPFVDAAAAGEEGARDREAILPILQDALNTLGA